MCRRTSVCPCLGQNVMHQEVKRAVDDAGSLTPRRGCRGVAEGRGGEAGETRRRTEGDKGKRGKGPNPLQWFLLPSSPGSAYSPTP